LNPLIGKAIFLPKTSRAPVVVARMHGRIQVRSSYSLSLVYKHQKRLDDEELWSSEFNPPWAAGCGAAGYISVWKDVLSGFCFQMKVSLGRIIRRQGGGSTRVVLHRAILKRRVLTSGSEPIPCFVANGQTPSGCRLGSWARGGILAFGSCNLAGCPANRRS